ncbi:hypothetical protein VN97_g1444 [Penicillium thymicola]|uniref:Uncharacterized protein n=1 Tax=Penicillium thymicola TaxID=293382 RepID=A0AAI9XD70_PENTH|nr:hypothetical protein VN97_g1444 [Penicillium thymicola]
MLKKSRGRIGRLCNDMGSRPLACCAQFYSVNKKRQGLSTKTERRPRSDRGNPVHSIKKKRSCFQTYSNNENRSY